MSEDQITAYCMKCKEMRPMAGASPVYMANGRPATSGTCGVCGTRLFKIGASPAHAGMQPPEVAPAAKGKSAPKPAVKRAGSKLVIVESPAKARTVGRFLGHGYEVRASVGHIRDLLRSKLSVDLEHDFAPTYRVPNEKRELVKSLKDAAAQAGEVYLATDPDREGEAIAWHLLEAAELPHQRTRRVVFHEITRNAISEAFAHSRDIDMQLVDAQQARRILDRLVGYQVSPLLWDRVQSRLSAGRVQSVALRLIVEREREIAAFVAVEYWSLDAELAQAATRTLRTRPSFLARLIRVRGEDADLRSRADAEAILAELAGAAYAVSSVKRGERRRRPYAPFTTSTLQQDAAQRLGLTAQRTMRVAQELYEGIDVGKGDSVGLITYMRTDSVNVAQEAQAEARALIAEQFGPEFLPPEPNVYKSRAKNIQEAHEAIRPTSSRRTPSSLREKLSREQGRLYELIWQRFVASQMAPALYDTLTVDVEAGPPSSKAEIPAQNRPPASTSPYLFRANGSTLRFPGFLAVYTGGASGPGEGQNGEAAVEGKASPARKGREYADSATVHSETSSELVEREILPDLNPGELLDLVRLLPEQHFTQPPARFSEATLVKALEEDGIGRPSTYAAIITTILDRSYVIRAEKRLVPTDLGYTVNDLLVKHFDSIFSVGFTATMEEHLDNIASGQEQMAPVLRDFYNTFGPQLRSAESTMEKVSLEPEKIGERCPDCGGDLIVKSGRYGKFIGCANYPTCRYTRPLVNRIGVVCPKDAGQILERRTKTGKVFYGCENYPGCDFTSWKRPIPEPCPHCKGLLVVATRDWAECTVCHRRTRLEGAKAASA